MGAPQRKLSGEAIAAQSLEDLGHFFRISLEWNPAMITEAAETIVHRGRTEQAVMAFVTIPADERYAKARMALLWRILLVPEHHRHTPWNRSKFDRITFLPKENETISLYLLNNTNILTALAGPPRCTFDVIEGGLSTPAEH